MIQKDDFNLTASHPRTLMHVKLLLLFMHLSHIKQGALA